MEQRPFTRIQQSELRLRPTSSSEIWKMSLVLRLRQQLVSGSLGRSFSSAEIRFNRFERFGFKGLSGQAARQEVEDEDEEVDIDPRRLPADYDPSNFDPTEHRSPPTARVWRLVDEVAGLTLSEISDLSTIMMKKMGMKGMPTVAVMKAGAAAGLAGMSGKGQANGVKEEKKVEKTVFELKLESYEAASKIKVIKEVRSFTDLGLKEAKDLVEKTPAVLKAGVSKEEGEAIIEKMKALGAKVVLE